MPPLEVRIEQGEICVRGPTVSPGYLGSDRAGCTDGWLRTGDLGRLDDRDNLFITGRAKDLIIRSGHNIDPALIEGCLERHPDVAMAAAVGMADEYAGELPVVYVQLRAGATASAESLLAYAAEHIDERPACPKRVIILDALPVTAVGKVFKPRLREDITVRLLNERLVKMAISAVVQAELSSSGQLQISMLQVPAANAAFCKELVRGLNLTLAKLAISTEGT